MIQFWDNLCQDGRFMEEPEGEPFELTWVVIFFLHYMVNKIEIVHLFNAVWNIYDKNIILTWKENRLTLSFPQVTKTEFLLTISIQYQVGRWWE